MVFLGWASETHVLFFFFFSCSWTVDSHWYTWFFPCSWTLFPSSSKHAHIYPSSWPLLLPSLLLGNPRQIGSSSRGFPLLGRLPFHPFSILPVLAGTKGWNLLCYHALQPQEELFHHLKLVPGVGGPLQKPQQGPQGSRACVGTAAQEKNICMFPTDGFCLFTCIFVYRSLQLFGEDRFPPLELKNPTFAR